MKKILTSLVFLAVLSTSCSTQPTPPPVPTPDLNALVGTMMAATLTAIAPTPAPPTETPLPEPTPTVLPPGTLMEEFGSNFKYPNAEYWSDPMDASLVKHNFGVSVNADTLKYDFADPETYLYTFYQKEMPADVTVETTYNMDTTQSSEASVVCRVDPTSRNKWYEFRVIHFERAAVIYYFERKDVYQNPYTRLAYAKLSVELFRDQPNRIEGRCQGNKLTISVNGQEITSVEDTRLTSGGLVGMGGVSHSKVPMSISYLNLNVHPAQ